MAWDWVRAAYGSSASRAERVWTFCWPGSEIETRDCPSRYTKYEVFVDEAQFLPMGPLHSHSRPSGTETRNGRKCRNCRNTEYYLPAATAPVPGAEVGRFRRGAAAT